MQEGFTTDLLPLGSAVDSLYCVFKSVSSEWLSRVIARTSWLANHRKGNGQLFLDNWTVFGRNTMYARDGVYLSQIGTHLE